LTSQERYRKVDSSASCRRQPEFVRALGFVPIALAIACGSGGAKPDGNNTGGAAGTGQGGGTAGTTGSGLPICDVGPQAPSLTDCSDFTITGSWVTSDRAVLGDGGIYLPGGELVTPMGGTIPNGDYDLIKSDWSSEMTRTRRSIRVFEHGAFIAWAVDNDEGPMDAGATHYRINSMGTVAENVIQVTQYNCGIISNYSFTVSGQQLLMFNLTADALFTYQQRCTR
jgi:hypothetical protein